MALSSLAGRLGIIVTTPATSRAGRSDDPVGCVLLQTTLVEFPRAAGAKRLREHWAQTHPNAEVLPYAWHLVSHGVTDGLRGMGTRALPGDPERFGGLQNTPEVDLAWSATEVSAAALGAQRIVLRTPSSLSPGALGQARLRAFVTARRAQRQELVWEPEGLWEADQAAEIAQSLAIPWIAPAFAGRRVLRPWPLGAWLRVEGTGPTSQLDERAMLAILELVEATQDQEDARLLFAGSQAYANLRRLVAFLADDA